MSERDIYQENNSFIIKKEINGSWINFGIFDNLDEAITKRDELEEYGWPCDKNDNSVEKVERYIYKQDDKFLVYNIINNKEIIFGSFDDFKKAKSFKRKLLESAWNVNFSLKFSEYGRYIIKANNKFTIQKSIDGVSKRFGYFKNLDEALVVRDELIENNWNMSDARILSNLGIDELKGKDENIGKIGRSYTVYRWVESRCTLFGFFNNHRDAIKVRDKLAKSYWNDESNNVEVKDTKYITKVGNSYRISKMIDGSINYYGYYKTLEEAIEIRNKLLENNWDISIVNIPKRLDYHKHIHKSSRGFRVVNRINGELVDFGCFDNLDEAIMLRDNLENNNWVIDSEDEELSEEKYDEFIFLKNDNKYYIKKEIEGINYIFGVFDNPLDAIAARLDCIKNNWELVSVSEEEYFEDSNVGVNFGSLINDENNIEETVYSEISEKCIGFPVTVGKSYKNRGWAIKRTHLEKFVPPIPYEKECTFLVEGFEVSGKINIHPRLFYFPDDELSFYLTKLSSIDPKTQTRIDLDLDYGVYEFKKENVEGKFIKFSTKFSKSFRKGMFVLSRNLSKIIIPELPYESGCNFSLSGLDGRGRFNLEFRLRFSDKDLINYLDSIKNENDYLDVILVL